MSGAPRPPTRPRLSRRQALALAGGLGVVALGVPAGLAAVASPPRASPWSERPRVALDVVLDDELRVAVGTERIEFVPDAPVTEIVLRAWPNRPSGARDGTVLEVTTARVDGTAIAPRVLAAGAPEDAPGTLIELPLASAVPAGTTVSIEVGFRLRLGEDANARVGTATGEALAWFASAHPMLAWVRGRGWARDDAQDIAGETATSEDAVLDLAVTVPGDLVVTAVGAPAGVTPGPRPGTAVHRFRSAAVRDVAVGIGAGPLIERTLPGGERLRLLAPVDGTEVDPQRWCDIVAETLPRITELLGPCPYPDLAVTLVPSQSSGVEFPGAMQFGDLEESAVPSIVAHELAHQWFYGLVGNNQARHPWLDESFATMVEVLVTGRPGYDLDDVPRQVRGDLGDPMARWAQRGRFSLYYEGVYRQGAAALLEGRRRVGEDAFDRALRAYVDTNAHAVVEPTAVAGAFAALPEVLDVLHRHGALPDPT